MNSNRRAWLFVSAILAASLWVACGQNGSEESPALPDDEAVPAAEPARQSHVFKGRVEAVDATAKSLTVFNENVEGWMAPMSMSYAVDKDDVLTMVKPGDQITATVYDGDFKTLYDVQVVEGAAGAPQ